MTNTTKAAQSNAAATHDEAAGFLPILPQSPNPYEMRRAMIAEAAYLRAKQRGFVHGHELDDWLAAENELKDWPA